MPGTLPKLSDFPDNATVSIISPAPSDKPTNILILLHGLGDSHLSFATFGERLGLPETACVSLRGPANLPFDLEGFHWGEDMIFDQATGDMEVDTGFKRSTKLVLEDVIRDTLVGKCGYKLREILLFGFGQGGMVALNVASDLGSEELGGVVSIGGAIPTDAPLPVAGKKSRTPVIVCKGNQKSRLKENHVRRIQVTFEFAEVKQWAKVGDGMPSNREEMLPIMQFFARRLKSVKGVPEGSVEIG